MSNISESKAYHYYDRVVADSIDHWLTCNVSHHMTESRDKYHLYVIDNHLLVIDGPCVGVLPMKDLTTLRRCLIDILSIVAKAINCPNVSLVYDYLFSIIRPTLLLLPKEWTDKPEEDGWRKRSILVSGTEVYFAPPKGDIPRGSIWICDERDEPECHVVVTDADITDKLDGVVPESVSRPLPYGSSVSQNSDAGSDEVICWHMDSRHNTEDERNKQEEGRCKGK